MDKPIQTRPHHLPDENYQGPVTVAFTCCIKNKKHNIAKEEIVTQCAEILIKESTEMSCDVLAYVFMPDHCHILLQGKSEHANTLKAMRNYKQKSGFWFSKTQQKINWQKSFYDRIIRSDEDIDHHIRYVLENPVRKEIVEDWKKYPWKGSTVFDLNEWCP